MITPEQKEYVVKQRANGISDEEIAKNLLEYSYTNEQIADLLTNEQPENKKSLSTLRHSKVTRLIVAVTAVVAILLSIYSIFHSGVSSYGLNSLIGVLTIIAPFIIFPAIIVIYILEKVFSSIRTQTSDSKTAPKDTLSNLGWISRIPLYFTIFLLLFWLLTIPFFATIFYWSLVVFPLFVFAFIIYKAYKSAGIKRYGLLILGLFLFAYVYQQFQFILLFLRNTI